jgi:uncharacterized protein (TIGR02001 family)
MKQKSRIASACVALVLGAFSAPAQTAAPAPAPAETPASSWVVTPSFVSQYMLRGVRLGGPSFQPTIEFDSGNLAIGVWASTPIRDKVPGQSDPEIDPYGSYAFTVNNALSVVPGFIWYNYPRADRNAGFYKATFEPSLAVNYTVGGIKLTPKLYYDMVLKGSTYELTAAFALPLKDAGTELDFAATIGTCKWTDFAENTSPAVKNWGDYWQLGVSMPFAVSKDSKVIVGFAYTEGGGNFFKQGGAPRVENTAAVGRGVVTLGYSIAF